MRSLWYAAVLAGMAVGAYLGIWATGGSTLQGIVVSPDGRERLEYYSPARWQGPYFHSGIMPVVIRLTTTGDNAVVGESRVVDIGGGSAGVIWRRDFVQVGSVALYRRSTGRWEVDA
ncbi:MULTISPECIES: hypothetical protein [Sphingosinicellaceae]|uniref:hypothetical protein n=1 Tax=Sphingosinicellaceae TaxID=2820280 RepID=UPI001C1E6C98|nr:MULTISPECIES: hypothetical protein [Polymorphobacter]QYE34673.1 hypothetical protein KZX46_18250 [Polymorphobacter sp. PAMC 29334]UAJ09880.1 hypothetical protein KTC28_16560 [Polymorphobacter megasporae]